MMIIMSLTTLVANLFIELNKIKEIRKIYFSDIYKFDNILKEEANTNGYTYYSQTNSIYFYELKYSYSMFFDVYEDEHDYIVKLKNNVTINDLIDCFKDNIGLTESQNLLTNILDTINFNEIYFEKQKKIQR